MQSERTLQVVAHSLAAPVLMVVPRWMLRQLGTPLPYRLSFYITPFWGGPHEAPETARVRRSSGQQPRSECRRTSTPDPETITRCGTMGTNQLALLLA